MKAFDWIIPGLCLGGILLLSVSTGQALVTPEHYQRIQMEKKQKKSETVSAPSKSSINLKAHYADEKSTVGGKGRSK